MKRDDDLFLETLDQDDDLAWKLAAAAALPAPAALRERIVARHRRRGAFGLPAPLPVALAFAVVALVVLPLSLALVQTRAELERERALREEYALVLAAIGGGQAIRLQPTPAGANAAGILVIGRDEQAYLVLDLPAPPAGKAYEAWIIRGGEPVRAGMAPVRTGVVTVRLAHAPRPGDVTAVTLEDAAGVDRPTTDPLLVATRIPPG